MKITSISYKKQKTLQEKQFEPVDIEFAATADVEDGENLHLAMESLKSWVNGELEIEKAILTKEGSVIREGAKIVAQKQIDKIYKQISK